MHKSCFSDAVASALINFAREMEAIVMDDFQFRRNLGIDWRPVAGRGRQALIEADFELVDLMNSCGIRDGERQVLVNTFQAGAARIVEECIGILRRKKADTEPPQPGFLGHLMVSGLPAAEARSIYAEVRCVASACLSSSANAKLSKGEADRVFEGLL